MCKLGSIFQVVSLSQLARARPIRGVHIYTPQRERAAQCCSTSTLALHSQQVHSPPITEADPALVIVRLANQSCRQGHVTPAAKHSCAELLLTLDMTLASPQRDVVKFRSKQSECQLEIQVLHSTRICITWALENVVTEVVCCSSGRSHDS